MPAKAVCQAMHRPHVLAPSRAGSVLQGLMVNTEFAFDRLCRSWLASEGGASGDAQAGCTAAIPSKLGPTGDLRRTQILRSLTIKTVGASLLAMAVCQAMHMPHVPASSRAGSVPQGTCGEHRICVRPRSKLWERARSRRRCVRRCICRMCRPLPEQARSHRGSAADTDFAFAHDPNCGSEPAREGGVSGDAPGACTGLIPSRLGPTGDLRRTQILRSLTIKTVGASLLAKAVCQAMHRLDVPPPSRASSVPQRICGGHRFCVRSRSKL